MDGGGTHHNRIPRMESHLSDVSITALIIG